MPTSFNLPALRSLGELADHSITIVIDTREQAPLVFSQLQSVRGTLTTGDYSIQGLQELFSVERKSVGDLVGCCMGENRERFERELHRLRGFRHRDFEFYEGLPQVRRGDLQSSHPFAAGGVTRSTLGRFSAMT